MKPLLIFFTFLLTAQTLAAEELVVRSGEHGSFTRIVLDRPKDITWEIEATERTLNLNFSEQVAFDASEVFLRIGKDRVNSVSQDISKTALLVELNCPCTHEISETQSLIIVDFFDSAPQKDQNPTRYSEGPFSLAAPKAPDLKAITGNEEKKREDSPIRKSEIQRKIAIAASNGLLSPIDRGPASPKINDSAASADEQKGYDLPGIHTIDAISFAKPNLVKDTNSEECEFPRLGGSEENTKPAHLLESVRELREASLFDPDPDISAIAIARLYLQHGLGIEARRHLENVQSTTQEVHLLKAISFVVDGDSPSEGSTLSNKVHCKTELGLWSFIGGSLPSGDGATVSKELVSHFQSLPKALRNQIATTFLQKLQANGMHEEAETVAGLLERLDADKTPAKTHEDTHETETLWGSAALRAMESVASAYEQGEGIADELVSTLQAFSIEYRGTELEHRLLEAEVLALAVLGQFEASLGALAALPQKSPQSELKAQIFDLITRNANDVTFAANLLPELEDLPTEVSADLGLKIAARFFSLGFYREAEELLGQKDRSEIPQSKLIQAKIALKNELPYRALALLYNVGEPEAEALQSEANDLIRRQNPDVFQVFPDPGNTLYAETVNNENPQIPEANTERDLASRLEENSLSFARKLLKSSEALRESLASEVSH